MTVVFFLHIDITDLIIAWFYCMEQLFFFQCPFKFPKVFPSYTQIKPPPKKDNKAFNPPNMLFFVQPQPVTESDWILESHCM